MQHNRKPIFALTSSWSTVLALQVRLHLVHQQQNLFKLPHPFFKMKPVQDVFTTQQLVHCLFCATFCASLGSRCHIAKSFKLRGSCTWMPRCCTCGNRTWMWKGASQCHCVAWVSECVRLSMSSVSAAQMLWAPTKWRVKNDLEGGHASCHCGMLPMVSTSTHWRKWTR